MHHLINLYGRQHKKWPLVQDGISPSTYYTMFNTILAPFFLLDFSFAAQGNWTSVVVHSKIFNHPLSAYLLDVLLNVV